MAKAKTFYQCQACGHVSAKWLGKCPDCGTWNSMVEERQAARVRHPSLSGEAAKAEPRLLREIERAAADRISTGTKELDRVLGGGIVPGSVTLFGGDPGIGKSTLLLQACAGLSRRIGMMLYASGEESPHQIRMRAERLSVDADEIVILSETSLDGIIDAAGRLRPAALVVDSIQTVYTEDLPSAPGSVGQVRECAAKLMLFAKRSGIPVLIVGHVTKEGTLAGPRVLEHIVDTVLYFEADSGHSHRILRTVKNRFGSTNEIGIFEMTDAGLREVDNPSELFLSERPVSVSGSTVVASIEGTRPLMIEIQALVSPTNFGMPRRTAIGVDPNRVNLLAAVMEKRAGFQLGGMDIFVNVVGGLRIVEPAVDLGIVTAIASSGREKPMDSKDCVFGEVGLSGEVRAVALAETRLKEAAKIGFRRAFIPAGNAAQVRTEKGLTVVGVRDIGDFLAEALRSCSARGTSGM